MMRTFIALVFALISVNCMAQQTETFSRYFQNLPPATVPLTGTEPTVVLQSSTAKQTSVANVVNAAGTFFNVLNFGAKCDGATDDSAAFVAAQAAAAAANYKVVLVPSTTAGCALASTFTINNNFVRFVGTGQNGFEYDVGSPRFSLGSHVVWVGPAGGTVVKLGGLSPTNQAVTGAGWEGISVDCNSSAASGIVAASLIFGHIKELHIHNCTTVALDVTTDASLGSAQHNEFRRLAIRQDGNSGDGIRLESGNVSTGNASFNLFADLQINYTNGNGISCGQSDNNDFINVQEFQDIGGSGKGVLLKADGTFPCQSTHFYHLSPGAGGVTAQGTETAGIASVENTVFSYDQSNGSPTPVLGTGVGLQYCYDTGKCNFHTATGLIESLQGGPGDYFEALDNNVGFALKLSIVEAPARKLNFNIDPAGSGFKNPFSMDSSALYVNGPTSGIIKLLPQTNAGTWEWDWPTTVGSAGSFLTSQGGGPAMTWTAPVTTSLTDVTAPVTWSPTAAAGSGTLGATTTNSANYTKIGQWVFFVADITVNTVGTGAGDFQVTLPTTPISVISIGSASGREQNNTGNLLGGLVTGANCSGTGVPCASITYNAGVTPISTNSRLIFSGQYKNN
jgi:hypothetical protein